MHTVKQLLCLWFLLAIGIASAQAEVVVLRSGQQVRGEILLDNDDVVILRKKDGLRYQYPKAEVIAIRSEASEEANEARVEDVSHQCIGVRFTVAGGAAYIPRSGWGGSMDTHLMVGVNELLEKQLFVGGSVGYRGVFVGETTYSWLPLQFVLQCPIAQQSTVRHRPLLGVSFGYSFAMNKRWGGGLCAGVDVGWWYRINQTNSLLVALTAQWQQTHIDIVEIINQIAYTNHIGCNIVSLGLKVGIQF